VSPTPEVAWWSAREGAGGDDLRVAQPVRRQRHQALLAGGRKLPDEVEARLEDRAAAASWAARRPRTVPPTGAGRRAHRRRDAAHAGYAAAVAASLEGRRLDGLRVGRRLRQRRGVGGGARRAAALGAEVDVLHGSPDGVNINDGCGSTHPVACSCGRGTRAPTLGVAFDGDADRVLLVDAGRGWSTATTHRHVRHRPPRPACCRRHRGRHRA
jgi:phosphoglucosamine mutase